MSPFFFTQRIKSKLNELHGVEIEEVREAFFNRTEEFKETRVDHLGENEKYWFIAETDERRLLKVVLAENGDFFDLVTAYDPDEEDLIYYEKLKKEK